MIEGYGKSGRGPSDIDATTRLSTFYICRVYVLNLILFYVVLPWKSVYHLIAIYSLNNSSLSSLLPDILTPRPVFSIDNYADVNQVKAIYLYAVCNCQ